MWSSSARINSSSSHSPTLPAVNSPPRNSKRTPFLLLSHRPNRARAVLSSSQIEKVIILAGPTPSPTPIGALTSDNRDKWTDARIALIAASPSGSNAKNLEKIESAMIIVPLDDTKPVTREAISWGCWVGDGRNRFYDKHQRACLPLPIVFQSNLSFYNRKHLSQQLSCMTMDALDS